MKGEGKKKSKGKGKNGIKNQKKNVRRQEEIERGKQKAKWVEFVFVRTFFDKEFRKFKKKRASVFEVEERR